MPSFCYCLTVQEIYYEKKSLTPILGLGFCMSEKDCNEYRWIVVTFEWILPSFMKLFTICSFCSLVKIFLVNNNGVFFVQNIWFGKGKIFATLLLLWEALGLMSSKFNVVKFFQSVMTWLYEPFDSYSAFTCNRD